MPNRRITIGLINLSRLAVVDNSGAKLCYIIGRYGQAGKSSGVGNIVNTVIKEAKGDKVKKGEICKAIILETKHPYYRKNGSHIKYMRNACALLTDKGQPVGNRINSMLPYEFNKPHWSKIKALSPKLF